MGSCWTCIWLRSLEFASHTWRWYWQLLRASCLGLQRGSYCSFPRHYDISSNILTNKLGWNHLQTRWKRQNATTVYKAIHELTPVYLQNLFTPLPRSTDYYLNLSVGRNKRFNLQSHAVTTWGVTLAIDALFRIILQKRRETSKLYLALKDKYVKILSNRAPTRKSQKTASIFNV